MVWISGGGKLYAGVNGFSIAPCCIEVGIEVQDGHEGLHQLQRSNGIGIVDGRADGDSIIVGEVLHRKGLVGLDGSHLIHIVA